MSRCAPQCRLGWHEHSDRRIVLTLRGRFDTHHGSRAFDLEPWEALYRPAFDRHNDVYREPTHCVTITLPATRPQWDGLGGSPFALADEAFPQLARSIALEMQRADEASAFVLDGLAAQLVAHVLRRGGEREKGRPRWIRDVRERVEAEYASPPALEEIARAVNHDVTYVAAAFKHHYGKSIGAFVRELRVWHARKLVSDPEIRLADVAQRSGFADQSHFARLFKRQFSVSPGEYRRRQAS
ncbi:MAG TPA: AraC family transcriptional regulator [Candidatus Baltobacteraceae bacterium]|jgi:AraC family transcriptional regulator|nr:AraC family transcriptional regulator [Candidatus Baltobacteraceae bacterium]